MEPSDNRSDPDLPTHLTQRLSFRAVFARNLCGKDEISAMNCIGHSVRNDLRNMSYRVGTVNVMICWTLPRGGFCPVCVRLSGSSLFCSL
jgi:hypothetical protein